MRLTYFLGEKNLTTAVSKSLIDILDKKFIDYFEHIKVFNLIYLAEKKIEKFS